MFNIIEKYMNSLTKEDINNFALKNNCQLSNQELDFTYSFIKNNWQKILKDHNSFNINNYKKYYSEDNFSKIKLLYEKYYNKFNYLL